MALPIHTVFNVAYNGIARELRSQARITDPLTGNNLTLDGVIWDTGATNSVINRGIAPKLGLVATGMTQVGTANGTTTALTYVINISLPPLDAPHTPSIVDVNVTEGDLRADSDMLIGMDVIGIGDFIVQNCDNKTHFSFCLPPFVNKLDMINKANQINERNAKKNAKKQKRLLGQG